MALTTRSREHKQSLGSAPFGRQCLIARRLIERGVRFVQIYQGGGHSDQNWDAHSNVENNLQNPLPGNRQADCRPANRPRATRTPR